MMCHFLIDFGILERENGKIENHLKNATQS